MTWHVTCCETSAHSPRWAADSGTVILGKVHDNTTQIPDNEAGRYYAVLIKNFTFFFLENILFANRFKPGLKC